MGNYNNGKFGEENDKNGTGNATLMSLLLLLTNVLLNNPFISEYKDRCLID
ncbi:MAG: hypothetical protein H7223_05405 [Pedobacter sp.]|nr:hypothetical protein [Pedobacter sp.]